MKVTSAKSKTIINVDFSQSRRRLDDNDGETDYFNLAGNVENNDYEIEGSFEISSENVEEEIEDYINIL